MQDFIFKFQELREEHSGIISEIEQNRENADEIIALKREAVRIEGQIRILTEKFKIAIKKDDRIPTNKREEYLNNKLMQLGVNESQLSSRRLAALNVSREARHEAKAYNMKAARERLLEGAAKDDIISATQKRHKSTASIAKDTTKRLERARENLKDQIQQSTVAVNLIKEGSGMLNEVADATSSVDTMQGRARRALKKLKTAQDLDTLILKIAIYFFAVCCVYVVLKRLTNNIITRAIAAIIRKLLKGKKPDKLPEPSNEL